MNKAEQDRETVISKLEVAKKHLVAGDDRDALNYLNHAMAYATGDAATVLEAAITLPKKRRALLEVALDMAKQVPADAPGSLPPLERDTVAAFQAVNALQATKRQHRAAELHLAQVTAEADASVKRAWTRYNETYNAAHAALDAIGRGDLRSLLVAKDVSFEAIFAGLLTPKAEA